MGKPTGSVSNGGGGIQQLVSDLIAGLTASDENDANWDADLLWAAGDAIVDHLSEIREAEKSLPLPAAALVDAVLIRADPTACGADLNKVSSLSPPYSVNIQRFVTAVDQSGTRCLAQTPDLAKSPIAMLRVSAVEIIRRAQDRNSVPVLASLLTDKDPGVAYNAIQALKDITGVRFSDEPAFNQFVRNPEPYRQEWLNWWQS